MYKHKTSNNKSDIGKLKKSLEKIRKDNSLKDSTSAEQPLHRKTFFVSSFCTKLGRMMMAVKCRKNGCFIKF